MLHKIKSILILLLIVSNSVNAQRANNTITGKVMTADKLPASNINVVLLGSKKGTITDKKGIFTINNVSEGEYIIEFSLLGLETKTEKIIVKSNQTIRLKSIILNENQATLEEVVIVAQRLNQFAQKKTPYVTRLPLPNINTPQSYSIVTNALINEQISTDFGSSLKSVTGGNYIEANSGAVSFYARGFRADARIRNGLKFHNRARTPIENQNIERIEVLKGASTINYGSGFYGGLMNIVTKKPITSDKFEIGYNVGSFNLHKVTADFNKAIDANKTYLLRINGAFYNEDSFQEKGSEIRKHYFIAPSFTYKPSNKFSVTINSEFLRGKRNLNFARFINPKGVKATTWSDLKWDYNNSYTSKDIAGVFDRSILQFSANYNFIQHWKSKTSLSYSAFSFDAPYLMTTFASDSKLIRNIMYFNPEKGSSMNIRQDFVADYTFNNVKNKTLIGASFYKDYWEFTRKTLKRTAKKKPVFVDIIDLANTNFKITNLTKELFNSKPTVSLNQERSDQNLAVYLSNATTFNDKITVLAGVRYDDFSNDATITNGKKGKDNYDQGKLSYNFGLAIHPFNEKVSLFGNYMTGFNNEGPGMNKKGKFQNFDPVESKQWEAGLKFNLFNGKLKSTLSYYDIRIDNFILSYGRGPSAYKTQDGKVESKGIEADVIVNPLKGFNIVAGYTYNNAKNVKFRTPLAKNKRLPLTPEQTANVWASYKFTKGTIKGLGLGLGANYVSKIYQVTSYANTFWAKPYTTVDGTIFYQQPNYRIGVKLNNLTNKEYYNAYGIAQKPFNFVVGLTYKIY